MRIIIAMMLLIALSAYAAPPVATHTAQITWDRSKQPQRVTVEEMLAMMKAKNEKIANESKIRYLPTRAQRQPSPGIQRVGDMGPRPADRGEFVGYATSDGKVIHRIQTCPVGGGYEVFSNDPEANRRGCAKCW